MADEIPGDCTPTDEVTTFCDLDRQNNVWVEGRTDPPWTGICMLDQLSKESIIDILRHDPKARVDLPKVTSNPELLQLLDNIPLLPTVDASDDIQRRHNTKGLPFYTVFMGRPPVAKGQGGK